MVVIVMKIWCWKICDIKVSYLDWIETADDNDDCNGDSVMDILYITITKLSIQRMKVESGSNSGNSYQMMKIENL